MEINKREPLYGKIDGLLKCIMRTFILLFCLASFGLTPKEGISQRITIDADKTVSVKEVFQIIKSQTKDYMFIYHEELLKDLPMVDLKKGTIRMDRLINQSLASTGLNVVLTENNTILIKEHINRFQKQVAGTVTDPQGTPIPGVTVLVKGTTLGTNTDFDGNYTIMVPNSSNALVFSSIGFERQEITVGERTSLDVILQESVSELDEVVVNAGYYTTTERTSTGSIEKVTADEIELQPVVNPLQALQGRMPGVEVVQQSGVTGLAASIQIRGQNSLRNSGTDNGNLPLFIVDGVPINSRPIRTSGLLTNVPGLDPLNALNLANVESIEVLKDADATAIYGSRGANGVVLITTKRAQNDNGKLSVEARLYSGISASSNKMELLNTEQYLRMRNEAFENDGAEPTLTSDPDLTRWDQNRYTDWQEELFGGMAEITNMNLSLSGGNAYTSFAMGGSYHKEGTVFPGDFGYQKATANFNLNHRSKDDKFRLNFSANYGIDENQLFNNTFVNLALTLPPNAPRPFDDEGNLNWDEGTWSNPFANLNQTQEVNSNNLLANMSLTYALWKGLDIKANLGYSQLSSKELIKSPKTAYDPRYWNNLDATSNHSNIDRSSWIIEPQLTYHAQMGDWNVQALAGLTFQNSSDHSLLSTGTGYSNESLIGNLAAADAVRVFTNDNIDYRYASVFGRIGLNWKERYFLNLTGRRDGSSRFGRDKRLANFGAVGAAWLFSEEPFFSEGMPWINYGKLRGSYGTTGSDQIPDYGYLDTYQPTPGPGGLYATQLVNPDYSWEVNRKIETALEMGMFKNRLQLGASWYRNRSSNQLVGYPLPSTTGFSTVQANLPAIVQNTGWEFSLSTINVQTKRLQWQTDLNLTIPRNKLVAFDQIEDTAYRNVYRVGEPLDIAILYSYEGIDPETGFYEVSDINEDGSYSYDDRVVIKNLGRKYYAGLNNSLAYQGITLQFLMEYVRQNNYAYFASAPPGYDVNQPTAVTNSWRMPGDIGPYQAYTQNITGFMSHYYASGSELVVGDASFLRLKTVTLSYTLPRNLMDKLNMAGAKIFVHGQNLLTFTDYLGLDPEGRMALPPMRTLTCGLQVKF